MTKCLENSYLAYTTVNPVLLKKYNRILSLDNINFAKEGIEECSTLYKIAIPFKNGYVATVEVCTGNYNANVVATLYDQNELELQRLDPVYDTLDNVYVFDHRGEEYAVSISKATRFLSIMS